MVGPLGRWYLSKDVKVGTIKPYDQGKSEECKPLWQETQNKQRVTLVEDEPRGKKRASSKVLTVYC